MSDGVTTQITGKDIMDLGYTQGRVVGLALEVSESLERRGHPVEGILEALRGIWESPEKYRLKTYPDLMDDLVDEIVWMRTPEPEPDLHPLKNRDYPVWGAELIDPNANTQMDEAMSLPVSVSGALMPDAQVGYGLPVGGVLATKNAVIPYAVGVDIACRMRLSVLPIGPVYLEHEVDALREILTRNTNFGMGGSYKKDRGRIVYGGDGQPLETLPESEIMDDPLWDTNQFLRGLKDAAAAQLGTSGTNNHFVEWGIFSPLDEDWARDELQASRPRDYLAILSHSGSRAVGAKICDRYTKIAKKQHADRLPPELHNLAWLDLDTEEGQDYWTGMELAGRFASATHRMIHEKMARALELDFLAVVENHHNFAWKEDVAEFGETIVHRKGATPAGRGVMGMIPGDMGRAGYVVRGKGNPEAINSASHGAGRVMSRRKAREQLTQEDMNRFLMDAGVELVGGSLEESPQAYKSVNEVLSYQTDLVEVMGKFTPKIVRMAPRQKRRF